MPSAFGARSALSETMRKRAVGDGPLPLRRRDGTLYPCVLMPDGSGGLPSASTGPGGWAGHVQRNIAGRLSTGDNAP